MAIIPKASISVSLTRKNHHLPDYVISSQPEREERIFPDPSFSPRHSASIHSPSIPVIPSSLGIQLPSNPLPSLPFQPRHFAFIPVFPSNPGIPLPSQSSLPAQAYHFHPSLPFQPTRITSIPVFSSNPGVSLPSQSSLPTQTLLFSFLYFSPKYEPILVPSPNSPLTCSPILPLPLETREGRGADDKRLFPPPPPLPPRPFSYRPRP